MRTFFSFAMMALVILFYLSNPKNKLNQWCAIGGLFFWIGIIKEAGLHEIVPWLGNTFRIPWINESYEPIHSVLTWAIYTFAMPTMTIAGLYFGYIEKSHPKYMRLLKIAMFLPGAILLLFFSPDSYKNYQETSKIFWVVLTIYNFGYGIAITLLGLRGIKIEKKSIEKKHKNPRKQIAQIMFLPMYYWLISIFIVHLFNIFQWFDLKKYRDVWMFDIIIVFICIATFIISAFKDGFMGLKLVTQKSDMDAYMSSINANASNAKHVLNTHTVNMKSSIYLLEVYNNSAEDNREKISERLDILLDSITYLEDYFDRIMQHSQNIQLKDESWRKTKDLLKEAEESIKNIYPQVSTMISVNAEVELFCDKVHMTEVFVNIIKNAAEAMHEKGTIEITGIYTKTRLKNKYQLRFKDNGDGIDNDKVKDIFTPHATTKNKDKNLGLGLAYSRNVITAHSGNIFVAESIRGKGTTIEIDFPPRRVRETSNQQGKKPTRNMVVKELEK